MSDLVTNAYGKTDAFGKGNLTTLLANTATDAIVRAFYNKYYNMGISGHGNDWDTLFGPGNPLYDETTSTLTPIGSLLKQQTITTDTVELITADVVIQIMKQLENAMQIANKVRALFDSKIPKAVEDFSRKMILNELEITLPFVGTISMPVVNKLNLSIIQKINTTKIYRRYVIFESTLTYFSISEVEITDYNDMVYRLWDEDITVSSTYNGTYPKGKLTNGSYGAEVNWEECWHSGGKKPSVLSSLNGSPSHWVVIDLGAIRDIGQIKLYSRHFNYPHWSNETKYFTSGGSEDQFSDHTVYLTNGFDAVHNKITGNDVIQLQSYMGTHEVTPNKKMGVITYSFNSWGGVPSIALTPGNVVRPPVSFTMEILSTGTYPSENSWNIKQDTDGQIVVNGNMTPGTFTLSSAHLGYTGSYTLNMADSNNDGWDGSWKIKISSTDAKGVVTPRIISEGPVRYTSTRTNMALTISPTTTARNSARYVIVQLDNIDYSHYAEIQAYDMDGTLIPATGGALSVQHGPDSEDKHRDGNLANFSHTKNITACVLGTTFRGPWSMIDLGKVCQISTIKVIGRTGYHEAHYYVRIAPHRVYLSHSFENNRVDSNNYTEMTSTGKHLTSKTWANSRMTWEYDPNSLNITSNTPDSTELNEMYGPALEDIKTILENNEEGDESYDYINHIFNDIKSTLTTGYGGNYPVEFKNEFFENARRLGSPMLYNTMKDIYNVYFNNEEDMTMYELQSLNDTAYNTFKENKIHFTSRLGLLGREFNDPLSYYMENPLLVRNNRSMSAFASEFAVEMLQNSSLQSFTDDNMTVSDSPLSIGYAVIKDKNEEDKVLNVRMYVSYVIPNPFLPGHQIAISSGVNLLDLININKFATGITSSNFLTYLSHAMMILNSDEGPTTSFGTTNTRWEYGYPSEYDSLKCISSTNSYWEGQLIQDCNLRGSTVDIPKRIFNMIEYLNTNYSKLEHEQVIVVSYADGVEKIISIVKIIIENGVTSFQHKDGRVDNIFPINNIKSDMLVSGELQVENYAGEVLLHVDPVTDKTNIMGKFGVNQELHEITAMVDIDNLSNQNMSSFIDQFAPLILNTVSNMDHQITHNPFTGVASKAARYVIVQLDTDTYSHWAEIQAFGPDDNIYTATGGELSTVPGWAADNFAESKHRDGDVTTVSHTYKWSSYTLAPGKESSGKSWAMIDLGSVRPISKIKVISLEGHPDGSNRTSPHRVFLSHTWIDRQVDVDNYVAMSSSSSYLTLKTTVNAQTTYTYDPSINENTLGSKQFALTKQSDYTAVTLPLTVYTSMAPPVQLTRNDRFGKIQARVELPVRIFAVTDAYRVLYYWDSRVVEAKEYLERLKEALDAAETRAANAAILNVAIQVGMIVATTALPILLGPVGPAALFAMAAIDAVLAVGANAATSSVNNKIEGEEEEILEMIDDQNVKIGNLNTARNAQQVVVTGLRNDMSAQAVLLNMDSIYETLLDAQTALLFAMRLYVILRGYISGKVNDHFFTPELTTCYRAITASRYIYGEDVDAYLSRNSNKFKYKYISATDIVEPLSGWYNIYNSSSDVRTQGISVSNDIRTHIATYEPVQLTEFLTLVIAEGTPIFIPQASLLTDMLDDHGNENALDFFMTYLRNASIAVENANNTIRNYESNEVSKATKIANANARAAASNTQTFAEWQSDIDVKSLELGASTRRYDAILWAKSWCHSGFHSWVGHHHRTFGKCNDDWHDHMRGYWNNPDHGWIMRDTLVFGGNVGDSTLKTYGAWNYPNILRELGKEDKIKEDLQDEVDVLLASQGGIRDELQEYTFSHDWNPATHNRLKQVVSNLYKMYLLHGDAMKESKLSYTCIIPVTTNSDNVTSAMYLKIVLMLEDSAYLQLAISGRMLNVNDYTRDKSYRSTLMSLMGAFTAATQLVNYGSLLIYKSTSELLSTRITSDDLFNDRFGYGSLYLVVDNMTDSKVVQHEIYGHWNTNKFSSLFYPDSNTCLADAYDSLNTSFIKKYGFDPLNMNLWDNVLANVFMVPFKYDDTWRIVIMRYIPIDYTLYRVSCVIDVNEYIDQSIIAKGDSTFYGDLTVKNTNNREMFQVDTLNNTTANLYPFCIGSQNPRTMLDVRDTSVIDMNYFMSKVSSGLRELPAAKQIVQTIWGTITQGGTVAQGLATVPSSISITNDDDYIYSYRLNRVTNKASDTILLYHGLYPQWTGASYAQIMASDPDRAGLIEEFVLPSLQKVLDETLFYTGSIYSTLIDFVSGMKYSIHTVMDYQTTHIDVIGRGWNIQSYGINVITNPNIINLFANIDATIRYMNFIRYLLTTNVVNIPAYIRYITDTYPKIATSVYKYTLVATTDSVLDNEVAKASISSEYKVVSAGASTVISNIVDTSERVFHTSFIVTYLKDYGSLAVGDFGIIECRDSNYYYYTTFFKLDATTIVVFYVNMTKDYITPSVSVEGDVSIAGELSLSGLTTGENASTKYITIDPENNFLGINSNDRFVNYALSYTTLGSVFNTSHHMFVKNNAYPNAAFGRIAEKEEIGDITKDYSLFGSYSSTTMIRVSEMWDYTEIQERVALLNATLTADGETDAHWKFKRYYGPDISFEIKDKTGLTTELGEVKMVIDRVDSNGILHGGFGVQMVDPNLAGATNFDNSLKNIMYVNNDGEMYVEGIWLGKRLLKVNPTNENELQWGDKKLVFKDQLDAAIASEAALQVRVTALETAVLALQQSST